MQHSLMGIDSSADYNKKLAWDCINRFFLNIGHQHLKKAKISNLLLQGVKAWDACCVVGASTVPLIKKLIEKHARVTVIDFSEEMCSALNKAISPSVVNTYIENYLFLNRESIDSFKYIFADQLVNCLAQSQIPYFFETSSDILQKNGHLVCIIKTGLYDFDRLLLSHVQKHKLPIKLYDYQQNVIDYTAAKPFIRNVIDDSALNREDLINWYLGRGKEKRFTLAEIKSIEEKYNLQKYKLKLSGCRSLPSHRDLMLLQFVKK